MTTHLVIAPILLPLLSGILLLLLRRITVRWQRGLGLLALLAQVSVAVILLQHVLDGPLQVYALGNWQAPFGIVLVADPLAAWMVLITALLGLFALLYACQGADRAGRHFHVLFQLQLFGLQGAFLTGDLFNLFVFFEILLLASYGLLLHGSGPQRTRAGLHFVVINLAGSTLFLFAVGTLYGVFGTLNMADLAVQIRQVTPEQIGLVRLAGLLLFGVFALKAALVPLHLWLPAAYSAATAPVAALFVIMTKVGAYGILRLDTLLYGQGAAADLLDAWLLPLALTTLVLGTLGVMASTALRRQIAWLVVLSVGSLLTAFALGGVNGIAAGLYYLPHTCFAGGAFFLLADSIARRRVDAGDRFAPNGVLVDRRLLGGLFFILALLVAGLPPLSGFVGKFLILRAALDSPAIAWVLAIVLGGGLLTIIALARSGSVLFYRSVPGDNPAEKRSQAARRLSTELLPVGGLVLLCLVLVIGAGPVDAVTRTIAEQLLQPEIYIRAVLGGSGT
ncbi:monovalent cation/H+ antiporter subunit D [Thiohalophilus thiocyanatoxydans]|uniref:Multisubunit potassium/proton antiporter PhaD subunit n=1 Tax=Thiohalophilus thiocyanatoxydans TaxID=381308 RepID=A0A4R8IY68_9GAMM|nr:monovalent cation/H+ antiporter subunit D [Thiohalophilus thiocyanatoxydans]TDY02769.1 multisubunit potassium/proton antiporter PhaD subunit [Thiohalophilus thiocyanatoxydans]